MIQLKIQTYKPKLIRVVEINRIFKKWCTLLLEPSKSVRISSEVRLSVRLILGTQEKAFKHPYIVMNLTNLWKMSKYDRAEI